jgi:FlaA1/EpsC-like NDP-sugar epimerase
MRRHLEPLFWRQSRRLKVLADLGAWALAIETAYFLRLETTPLAWAQEALLLWALTIPVFLGAIHLFGLHRQSWGHVGTRDLVRLAVATGLTSVALAFVAWLLQQDPVSALVPRSVPLIAGMIAFLLTGGLRIMTRLWREGGPVWSEKGTRTLIVGTDGTGLVLARELTMSGTATVVGFLDENPLRQGLSIQGHPVLGSSKDLKAVVEAHDVQEVFIALDPKHPHFRDVMAHAQTMGIRFRAAPGVEEMLFGRFRPDGERLLPELLQRPAIQLDTEALKHMLGGKVVLVTGAGGSIGSEIVRQVCKYAPAKVVLVAHEENSLFEVDQELAQAGVQVARDLVIASVREAERIEHVFATYKPHVVFHAAAHKHVPMMEANADQAVLNNVFGTQNVAQAVVRHGVERFVNISTDKAVRTTNVMGASKRLAEMVTTEAARGARPDQHLVSVRFGNVLGSRGSVIPTWLKQIAQGGPLTVTDERMTRYFMLIPEAVQLVLQAAALGGQGRVYVLDMGTPVRILDVAHQLIRMHGLVPGQDIAIQLTGLRPGEKLYEELVVDESHQTKSPHPKIFIEEDVAQPDALAPILQKLQSAAMRRDAGEIRSILLATANPQLGAATGMPVTSKTGA